MEFQSFLEKLKNRLKNELPGEEAQFLMAPPSRKTYKELLANKPIHPRLSAVLILIYPTQNSLRTILIERPQYEGVHSGQIAFPGGKFDDEDENLLNTALREAKEEIGVELAAENIIGNLTDVYIYPSNFLVKPFVAYFHSQPDIKIDSREVVQHIETDLYMLGNAAIKKETVINYGNGLKLKTPYFDVEGFTVWGATAMMISELNAIIKDL